MNLTTKQNIENSLKSFTTGNLTENAFKLFETLGYNTERQAPLDEPSKESFEDLFLNADFKKDKAFFEQWLYADRLFQLTTDEIETGLPFEKKKTIDGSRIESYLFFVIKLQGNSYTRTQLSNITREVNKLFGPPAMILFYYGNCVTLSIIHHRENKKDSQKDVLEKVTLIKDIRIEEPHRAHIEILFELSLPELSQKYTINSFVSLHKAWQKTLDTKELNKQFYRELFNWYLDAKKRVEFPDDVKYGSDPDKEEETRNSISLVRLLTRLMFCWFLKEKKLLPEKIFDKAEIDKILNYTDKTGSTYYKAILQNLFFATLNTERDADVKNPEEKRQFIAEGKKYNNPHHSIQNYYRYKRFFKNPEDALGLFADVPFLNSGLFECLDKSNNERIDCFSDNPANETRLKVPDNLFFGKEHEEDLSEDYGDKKRKKETVRPLLEIFKSYKFTIEENTPLEEEIALDPELLGKVFENLLASYNPEKQTTARKQTGSFYTPREIVNYMVDESLMAYLETKLQEKYAEKRGTVVPPTQKDMFRETAAQAALAFDKQEMPEAEKEQLRGKLQRLFAYEYEDNPFTDDKETCNNIIDALSNCKILDPACGSGAFPMGILHKMTSVLAKLDPNNREWKLAQKRKAERDLERAKEMEDAQIREKALESAELKINEIEKAFNEKHHELDYLRKLFLIQDCIYGIDIQQIAIQISKLRFFISLIVEQKIKETEYNRGILSMPNLETKFVAANTLIRLDKSMGIKSRHVEKVENELQQIRKSIFYTRSYKDKKKLKAEEKQKREELKDKLVESGFGETSAKQMSNWDPFDTIHSASYFDVESMFGIKDGFDLVIGNPPYLGQSGNKEIFRPVKHSSLGEKYHQRRMDYFYFFFHVGIELCKANGVLSFITTNYFFNATYADKLRNHIKKECQLIQLVDFNEAKVFESAQGQHNAITFLQKTKSPILLKYNYCKKKEINNAKELEAFLYKQDNSALYTKLDSLKAFNVNNHIDLKSKFDTSKIDFALDEIALSKYRIADFFNINQGVVTGGNKISSRHLNTYNLNASIGDGIFILSKEEVESLKLTEFEKKFIKPWFKNSNVSKYHSDSQTDEFLIYYTSFNTVELKHIPNLERHFSKFKELLVNRNIRTGQINLNEYSRFVNGISNIDYVIVGSPYLLQFKSIIFYLIFSVCSKKSYSAPAAGLRR